MRTKTLPFVFYPSVKDDNQPLVFLHGFLGSAQDGLYMHELLHKERRLYALDLPGHGRCTGELMSGVYGMQETAEMVVATLSKMECRQPLLYGYSMGGRLALYLALQYPQYFSGFIIESASAGLADEEERRLRRAVDAQRAKEIEEGGMEAFLQKWYDMPLFKSLHNDSEAFEKMYTLRKNNFTEGLGNSLLGMGTGSQPSLWEKLPHINRPITLLVGENDRKFVTIAREMATLNSLFKLCIAPHSGHTVHREQKTVVYSVVDDV